MSLRAGWLVAAILLPSPMAALTPDLPQGAEQTIGQNSSLGRAGIAVAPFDGSVVPQEQIEGAVTRRAWRIMQPGIQPLALLRVIRQQVEAEGYRIRLDCAGRDCGGFDFRYGIEVLDEPEMHVDLGDYHYLSAVRGEGAERSAIAALISRDSASGFVQLIEVSPAASPPSASSGSALASPAATAEIWQPGSEDSFAYGSAGFIVLDGISFAKGSSTLARGAGVFLEPLVKYLSDRPEINVLIVGHTDTTGSLAANIAVSRRRAEAVRQELITAHGIAANRLRAEGAGYLAPRFPDPERNRRVEVVFMPPG